MTDKTNILFMCHSGQVRSVTAADLFKTVFNTKALGLYPYPDNTLKFNKKWLYWADYILVMKEWMKNLLLEHFPQYYPKVRVLSIDDEYRRNDPRLIDLLKMLISCTFCSHRFSNWCYRRGQEKTPIILSYLNKVCGKWTPRG